MTSATLTRARMPATNRGARPVKRKGPAANAARGAHPWGSRGAPSTRPYWNLRLYVAGSSPRSLAAVTNLTKVWEEHLPGQYSIEVVDLLEHPNLARADQILATPARVGALPSPIRRVIGDLSSRDRVLVGLEISTDVRHRRHRNSS